jgi:hypothetical protein
MARHETNPLLSKLKYMSAQRNVNPCTGKRAIPNTKVMETNTCVTRQKMMSNPPAVARAHMSGTPTTACVTMMTM